MNLSGRRILVTGAAGFIGSHLADRLAEDNDVICVDDYSIGLRENQAEIESRPNVRLVEADITDRRRMLELIEGVEVVYHLAISDLRTSIANPWLNHDVNAGGSLNLLLAARDRGVERFVYVSSSEVYGSAVSVPMSEAHPLNPITVYGASKLAGELYALACHRTYGLPVIVIRPFNTYGPREPYAGARAEVIPRFILQLLRGRPPVIYGDGRQTRDFTFTEDTVAGMVAAGACDELVGEVVNIAYGREASIREIAERLAELVGNPALEPVFEDPRPGDVDRHFADTSKARRLLGFEPKVELATGLARTFEWFERHDIVHRVDADSPGRPNW